MHSHTRARHTGGARGPSGLLKLLPQNTFFDNKGPRLSLLCLCTATQPQPLQSGTDMNRTHLRKALDLFPHDLDAALV